MANEAVDSLCRKAQLAVTQGNIEEAQTIYLEALQIESENGNVHYGLATVCYLRNDLEGAAYHFKEVTRIEPIRAGAYINLGAVLNKMDLLDEAIANLRKGIQLDATRAEGYYNLGLVYRRKGQIDLAIHAYREATRINTRMPDAHYNLANLYLEKEQFHLAVNHYEKALELKPDWPKARQGLEQAKNSLNPPTVTLPSRAPTPRSAMLDTAVTDAPTEYLESPRLVDPDVHGGILKELHQATKESELIGRELHHLVAQEIEPALKLLSNCLLYSNRSPSELDQCVEKLENALARMRATRQHLQRTMDHVQENGEKLLQK